MRKARVLVVDDDADMRHAVGRVLGGRYQVEGFALPSDALAAAPEFQPDLALLDVRMPEMDGYALLDALRREVPDVDAIFMTGSVHETDRQLIRAVRERAFYFLTKPFDRDVLLTLVERCLELRTLQQAESRHRARMERELREARAFQAGLLPPERAHLGRLRIEARWLPSTEVGGDLFDYVATPRGALMVLADVAGHGTSAAMLTGTVKSAFHAAAAASSDPAAVLVHILNAIGLLAPDRHASAIAARIDADEGTIVYANAGHPAGLIGRADGTLERLESTGPILAPSFPLPAIWENRRLSLAAGEVVAFYSDGLTDCVSARSPGFFDAGRVEAEVLAGGTAAAVVARVVAALDAFRDGRPLEDDVTVMAAELAKS
jgi:sigma-B regulation protein RsbU (phosphoserine phosphatase)